MMGTFDANTNTCIRGCCSSTTIPLNLHSYTLLSPIAKGSESTVYEAILSDGRRVAAKKPVLSTSEDLDKFHRELQLMCRVEHPGLATLVAANARPPNYMFFFQMYESRNLAEKLHVEEWIPRIPEALQIACSIAGALLYLHNLGILHRDVKPANILLDQNFHPYLADFGLAVYKKDLRPTFSDNWRSSGKPTGGFHKKNMVGTLIYMAPEILSKEMHTEKSDVYSFAVMMNEMLTGVVPYTDLRAEAQAHTVLEMNYTEQQLTAAVVAEGLRPKLSEIESGAPQGLLELIRRCWGYDPLLRPSMADVVDELKSMMLSASEICKKETSNGTLSDANDTANHNREGNRKIAEPQILQENLNWSRQGEQVSYFPDHVANVKVGMWSQSLHNRLIYKPKLTWGSFATCGRRETMEDTHFMLPEFCKHKYIHVFGIFDGHRGAAAAEFSARALPAYLQMLGSTTGPSQALTEAFIKTDIAFRKELASQYVAKRIIQKEWHPGCTAVATLIVRDMLFVANAGDCRTILCRRGQPCPLTKDHVASCPAERARVTKEGTEVKWQVDTWRVGSAALQVTRSIGDDDLKPAITAEPEISETLLSPEDEYLVMASDGLWDVISNEEVIAIIRDTVKDPGMCSKRLATEASERGSRDNITVIVVFLRPVSTAERIY